MFYSRNSQGKTKTQTSGRVYVLEMTLYDGTIIHKIGMTHARRSTDRMMEILRSWFMVYRYVPHTSCRMDHETGVPLLLEGHLHKLLKEFKWVPNQKVDGAQEMFIGLDIEEVIHYVKWFDYKLLLTTKKLSASNKKYIESRIALDESYCKEIPQ